MVVAAEERRGARGARARVGHAAFARRWFRRDPGLFPHPIVRSGLGWFAFMISVAHAAAPMVGSTFQLGAPYMPSMRTMRNLLAVGSTWKVGSDSIALETVIGAPARYTLAPTML